MENKKPVRINQVLKLPVNRFGKEGDLIFMYDNFIIFLKSEKRLPIHLNEFLKIRITKVLPTFALAVLVEDLK
jgi:predicted RNA-binding protein with TRAM domain